MPHIQTPIRSLADVEALERVPLAQRDLPPNTYELLRRSAERYGDATAICFLPQGVVADVPWKVSYRQLFARVTQAANAFHRLGVRPGQAVSFLLPNLPQTHYTLWGGEAAGIVNAINPLLEPEHIAQLVRAADSQLLVTLAPFPGSDLWNKVEALRASLPAQCRVVVVDPVKQLAEPQRSAVAAQRGPLPEGVLDFDALLDDCPDDRLESGRVIAPEDIASYFHTGGTTGAPKLAPHSHANEVAMAEIMGLFTQFSPTDVVLCGLPLFHVNGVIVTGLAPLMRGARVLLAGPLGYRHRPLLHDIWALVERYRVSFMSAVPTIYAALLDIPSEGHDLSSLRFALCGAASLPVEVLRQFELRTGVQIVEGYGLTEGTCGTSCNPPEGERRAGSVGLRLPYCETRIVVRDSTGAHVRDAVTDEIGQVCLRGPTVFRGYLHMEACADHWIEGGWFNTGDLGRIDAQGYLWLTGRSKDVIIRGGHNIDPQAIEEILYRHPAVAMAAAVGKPDVRVGELPVAYVQLKPGAQADEAELIEHAANQLSERAAVPKNIWLLEAMPLTAVGKIYKPCLRMDAVRRVLQHDVDAMGIPLHIDVLPDERHGQKARLIGTLDQGGRAALAEKLGGYAVHLEWVDTH